MHYQPRLNQPYSEADLEGILADSLRVLAELGIACEHRETIDRVTAEQGVRHDGGRLKFDTDVVREHVAAVRKRNAAEPAAEPPFEALPGWCCLNYADPETGEVRPPTTEEAARMTRLMDARGGKNWTIPLVPRDVPPRYATLTGEYVALSNSRGLGGFMAVTDPEEIEYLIEMNQAVGRTFLLDEQISISPLRFNDHGLASALRFQGRKDVNVILVGAIPAVGSTTPQPIRSALVEAAAETLALAVTIKRLGFGLGGFGTRVQPFDFQHTTMVFGGPEWMLYESAGRQLTEWLNGRRDYIGSFRSMSRMPDAQAAAERTSSVLWQAVLGARRFRGTGQMALDEVFSPQQAIFDDEILAQAARMVRGMDPLASSGDIVEEMAEGVAAGSFLGQWATVKGYRDFYEFPKLFHRYSVGRWKALGSPGLLAEAWERAQEQIASCDFHLPEEQARELERIYRRALNTIT